MPRRGESKINRVERKHIQQVPEGWMTKGTIKSKYSVASSTVESQAEQYRVEHPEWFQVLKTPTGYFEHYHPALVEKIFQILDHKAVKAPEGWKTPTTLAQELQCSTSTILKCIISYRTEHPEWFASYPIETKRGSRKAEYYHPDLITLIKDRLGDFVPFAPHGWMTNKALSLQIGETKNTINRIIEGFRHLHPNWFQEYRNPQGVRFEHYHPELIKEIIRLVKELPEEAPEGWFTNKKLAETLNVSGTIVQIIADQYREQHPQWFRLLKAVRGGYFEHYDPALVAQIEQKIKTEIPPAGWIARVKIIEEFKLAPSTIQKIVNGFRRDHPEWVQEYRQISHLDVPNNKMRVGYMQEYYHPELIKQLRIRLQERPIEAPTGWMTNAAVSRLVGLSESAVSNMINGYRADHPEWFVNYLDGTRKVSEHYHPELIKKLISVIEKRPESAPVGWMTKGALSTQYSASMETIAGLADQYRADHPEWFVNYLDGTRKVSEHYHPELVKKIHEARDNRLSKIPEGWMTNHRLTQLFHLEARAVKRIAQSYRTDHPEWFQFFHSTAGYHEYYSPELVELVRIHITERPEHAPAGWITHHSLSNKLRIDNRVLKHYIQSYRQLYPEWFVSYLDGTSKVSEHYHPNLVQAITERIERERKLEREKDTKKENEQKNIFALEDFTQEIKEQKTVDAETFQALTAFCGPARAAYLLYLLKPEFREGLPVERMDKVIAEYLGDFLAKKRPFEYRDLEKIVQFMHDPNVQEGLYETLKQRGLAFYYQERRRGSIQNDAGIVEAYLQHISAELGHITDPFFNDILERVLLYFDSLFQTIQKPPQIVDELRAGREFPDMNQRVNAKELSDKKRMLIADEMGLGKSGSVIFAKEMLHLKTALVVVPSNVIPTWGNYLSDQKEKGGYFKPGQAPRVLIVENVQQLQQAAQQTHDYIIISQERMQGQQYQEALQSLPLDMLIVDEVHKLKNLEGARANALLQLAGRMEKDKYVALLSGTPAPNSVDDIGVILKLLYPEQFGAMNNRELRQQILRGNILHLNDLLLPRMQMKRLEDTIEMPPLTERTHPVHLSPIEKAIYEALVEEDEITPTSKLSTLRKFLLNPQLVDPTPGIEGAKVNALSQELNVAFQGVDKIVVFTNHYAEDVIRGEDAILKKETLKLPPDVNVIYIHGEVEPKQRPAIQNQFNTSAQKTLLIVNGQTADVGVDFSAAEKVYFYNEPWTESEKKQQIGRAYRPGRPSALEVVTLITEESIEQGIREHILRKHHAIEKLLQGIPITEFEQKLLEKSAEDKKPDAEVNPDLAKYYYSACDRLNQHFNYVKGIGEEGFKEFLHSHAGEYAEGYREMGARSYQANAARVGGALFGTLIQQRGQHAADVKILDVASGPEMLRRHIADPYQQSVVSLDLNPEHFKNAQGEYHIGSFLALPFKNESVDYVNFSLALHYASYAPTQDNFQRAQVLYEIQRVLKVGGRAVLNQIYSSDLKRPELFEHIVEKLGCILVKEQSGTARSGAGYASNVVTIEKRSIVQEPFDEIVASVVEENLQNGLKLKTVEGKLKDSRRIIREFELAGQRHPIHFNEADQRILAEEQAITEQGERLKQQHGAIENIPRQEVLKSDFIRFYTGKKYVLFKKLTTGPGVVIIR